MSPEPPARLRAFPQRLHTLITLITEMVHGLAIFDLYPTGTTSDRLCLRPLQLRRTTSTTSATGPCSTDFGLSGSWSCRRSPRDLLGEAFQQVAHENAPCREEIATAEVTPPFCTWTTHFWASTQMVVGRGDDASSNCRVSFRRCFMRVNGRCPCKAIHAVAPGDHRRHSARRAGRRISTNPASVPPSPPPRRPGRVG